VQLSRTRWIAEATKLALRDPAEGFDRAAVKVGFDRQFWSHELSADPEWEEHIHAALGERWPCQTVDAFPDFWSRIQSDLQAAGLRTGRGAFGGWDDADEGLACALCCLMEHLRPGVVVETGVARGLTSRLVLESLDAGGRGHLWSIDRRPIDQSLHHEVGAAVPETLRDRWTYVEGTSRKRLRGILEEHGPVDIFIHDSLHTARNLRFELEHAWSAVRPGGAILADDVHRNDAFGKFTAQTADALAVVVAHSDGEGCFGLAPKPGGRRLARA
jgi:predicted O-methyltransferase YrrM